MKRYFKSLLYKILGLRLYLRLLYSVFAFLIDSRILKKQEQFALHYFSQKIIQKGDNVLDIGANLGYYTRLFLKATGDTGHVYAIEPVLPFYQNILHFLGKRKNLTIFNVALGEEEKKIQLTVPNRYGYIRTGLPRVVGEGEHFEDNQERFFFDAMMKKGSELFREIPPIDYLKIDVEGHEKYIIPEIKDFLAHTRPTIQIELGEENHAAIEELLQSIGYQSYYYKDEYLSATSISSYAHDFFYIHSEKIEKYKALIH